MSSLLSFKFLHVTEVLFLCVIVCVWCSTTGNIKKGKCKKLKFVERINQDNHEVSSVVGYDFKFDCRVIGTPEPNVTWTKDDMPLKDVSYRSFGPGGLEKVFILNLKNLLVADSGRYKCTADNGKCKAISTSLKLIIKENSPRESPRIKELLPIDPKVKVGEMVKFTCYVHKVNDFTPFIKWVRYVTYEMKTTITPPPTHNHTNTTTTTQQSTTTTTLEDTQTLNVERLTNSKHIIDGIVHQTIDIKIEKSLQSELVIYSASLADTGDYYCVVFNEIGFDKVVSHLEVIPEPPLSMEELERIYVRKYGTPVKLPFSLAAIVVIPVCLGIILIIGCVWWHSNEQRLEEEEKLKLEKQKCDDTTTVEEKIPNSEMIQIVSVQNSTNGRLSIDHGSYDVIARTKANPADVDIHTPVVAKKYVPMEGSLHSLKHAKSPNENENDDKAKLLVEDHHEDSHVVFKDEKSEEGNHPLA